MNSYSIKLENENLTFNNENLNINLDNFSNKNKYININKSIGSINWDSQTKFVGSSGNDYFYINNNTDNSELINNYFSSTEGNDVYIGKEKNVDLVDYSNLEDFNVDTLGYKIDHITGLEIFDEQSYETLNFNNSPLLDEQIFNDSLVVNKSNIFTNSVVDQIDILEDIEIIRFSPNDDKLQITELSSNNIYDFISGDDKLILNSSEIPHSLTNLLNLDKFIWNNLQSDQNKPLDSFEFAVKYLKEDNSKSVLIEDYNSNNFNEKLIDDYSIQPFSFSNYLDSNLIESLEIKLVDPLPEIINQGNPVLEQKFSQDINDENLFWLEIHIYDYRTHGKGFIGAGIDLEWNDSSITIDNNLFTNDNVFGNNKLPIFQNLGELSIPNESDTFYSQRTFCRSLPVASQGVVIGNMLSENSYTTFAKIPFRNIDINNLPKFNLTLNNLPAVKAISADKEKVVFIDQLNKALRCSW